MASEEKTKVKRKARPNPVFRKGTLRKMSPVTRQLARLIGEQVSVTNRLKNLLPKIKEMEQKDMQRQAETQDVMTRLK